MLTPRDDVLCSKAIKLKDRGDFSGARDILLDLVQRYPKNGGLHWFLGHLYWRLGRLDLAVESFAAATKIVPGSERASLGLFHCLWKQGRQVEALDEVKRFLALADSEDYREIIREINSTAPRD
jgi:tetratricopeptide (TPR) repeat protein